MADQIETPESTPGTTPAETPAETPADTPATTIAQTIVNSGLSREDVKAVFKECLAEIDKAEPPTPADMKKINADYFKGLTL